MLKKNVSIPAKAEFVALAQAGQKFSKLADRHEEARLHFRTLFDQLDNHFDNEEKALKWFGQFKPVPFELIEAMHYIAQESDIPGVCDDMGLSYFSLENGRSSDSRKLPPGIFHNLVQLAKQERISEGGNYNYGGRHFTILEVYWDKHAPTRGHFFFADQTEVLPTSTFSFTFDAS